MRKWFAERCSLLLGQSRQNRGPEHAALLDVILKVFHNVELVPSILDRFNLAPNRPQAAIDTQAHFTCDV